MKSKWVLRVERILQSVDPDFKIFNCFMSYRVLC